MRPLLALALALQIAAGSRAQEAGEAEPRPRPGLTGSWGGVRPWLVERGIDPEAVLVVDWSAPWRGGLRSRDTVRALLEAGVSLDLEEITGVPGTTVFAGVERLWGRNGSDDVGDLQMFSSLDARSGFRLDELWVESAGEAWRLKAGKVDANDEFAVVESAGAFAQASAGFTPTIVGFPSYPDSAFGVNLWLEPRDGVRLGGAVYDGAVAEGIRTGTRGPSTFFRDDRSSSWFWIAELRLRRHRDEVGLGAWHHSADLTRFDGGVEESVSGAYALVDVEAAAWERGGLDVFASGGLTDGAVSPAEWHVLAGTRVRGAFPGRRADSLGLLMSHVGLSDAPGAPFAEDETAFELHYALRPRSWLLVQPTLAVVVSPAGRRDVDDAWIGLLRVAIAF